jgi:hypothetical protein
VNTTPATFASLRSAVEPLVIKECARMQHAITRRHEKGLSVSDEMMMHARATGWLDAFVGMHADALTPAHQVPRHYRRGSDD